MRGAGAGQDCSPRRCAATYRDGVPVQLPMILGPDHRAHRRAAMARLSLLKPSDQPPGNRRLLADLSAALDDPRYSDLKWIVAYAKSGPLLRLRSRLEAWRTSGKTSAAIIGID